MPVEPVGFVAMIAGTLPKVERMLFGPAAGDGRRGDAGRRRPPRGRVVRDGGGGVGVVDAPLRRVGL